MLKSYHIPSLKTLIIQVSLKDTTARSNLRKANLMQNYLKSTSMASIVRVGSMVSLTNIKRFLHTQFGFLTLLVRLEQKDMQGNSMLVEKKSILKIATQRAFLVTKFQQYTNSKRRMALLATGRTPRKPNQSGSMGSHAQ